MSSSRDSSPPATQVDELSPRQPATKRTNTSGVTNPQPDHASQVQNAIGWLQHTLGLEVLKKSVMDITVKRNIVDRLHALSTANALLQIDHARLMSKHEASHSNIGDIISKFTTIISEKEHEISQLKLQIANLTDTPPNPNPVNPSPRYAEVTKTNRARQRSKSKNRTEAARDQSRVQKRTNILAEKRTCAPEKAYIFTPSEEFPALQTKKEI